MYEIGGIPREENATFVHLKPKSVIRDIIAFISNDRH